MLPENPNPASGFYRHTELRFLSQPDLTTHAHYESMRNCVRNDLMNLGFDQGVINNPSILAVEFNGNLIPAALDIQIEHDMILLQARLRYEIGYTDGAGREWDGRLFIKPHKVSYNGIPVSLPPFMYELGYQILIKKFGEETPTVRFDSVCLTGMFDNGHQASAGEPGLGCDCCAQRELGKELIFESGGVSILTPAEGRGNGLGAHASQIAMQNYAHRYNLPIPDTYQAVQLLQLPRDQRDRYYAIDALILKLFGGMTNLNLLTNNPEKTAAFTDVARALGIEVKSIPIHANENPEYYRGINFNAKLQNGHRIEPQ